MPRPPKFTPDRQQLILEAISAGATRKAAALHAGIDDATLYRWMQRYASFATHIARAEADVELRCTTLILNAAETDPRHAEWWLERRRTEDYGRRDRVEVLLRREAEKLAAELGVEVDEVLREAERILGG